MRIRQRTTNGLDLKGRAGEVTNTEQLIAHYRIEYQPPDSKKKRIVFAANHERIRDAAADNRIKRYLIGSHHQKRLFFETLC